MLTNLKLYSKQLPHEVKRPMEMQVYYLIDHQSQRQTTERIYVNTIDRYIQVPLMHSVMTPIKGPLLTSLRGNDAN